MDTETSEEVKGHFNVVAEGLRTDIRSLAEGLGANTDRLDRVESRLNGVDSRLDGIDTKFWRLEGRMTEEFREIKTMIQPFVSRGDR
jgi:hypothetical protein